MVIFAFDLSVPLGVAAGVPYVVPVLLGIGFPRRMDIFVLAAIGSVLTILGYFLSPEGGVFWVVLLNRGLALFAIWVTAFLIASRKQTEDALRDNEKVLRTFLDATIDQAAIVDPDGTIRAINQAMADSFARHKHELIGLPMFKSPPTATGRRRKQWIDTVLRTGRPLREEDEHDGVWYDNSYFPVSGSGGTVTQIAIFARDISARKQIERELIVAKDSAEVADRSKGEFLASMSHELRTPLNAIIGFSSSMLGETFGPVGNNKYCEYLKDIHDSGEHLLELITDVLDISAIEARALELHEEAVSLADIVQASVRIISPRADAGQVSVISSIDNDLPLIYVDERRVKQVLLNLLSNAVKFTPQGGTVTVTSQLNDNGSLEVVVSDTGMGMDEVELKKALSKFGQVDSGLNRKYEGTGLGLPLTEELVKLHGGTLVVSSKKGHGTQVTVTIPKERVGRTVA